MNALANQILFASAYRQLSAAERAFVDDAVAILEHAAARAAERISMSLHRPIPPEIVNKSRGMLERPMVKAAIAERINEIAAAQELTVQRLVREYMALAFSNIGDYMTIITDEDDNSVPYFDLTKATPEQMAAVKTVKMEESGDGLSRPLKRKIEIVLHDKLAAMAGLARFMGIDNADNPHWKADIAKAAPPAVTSPDAAADAYAAMIGEQ